MFSLISTGRVSLESHHSGDASLQFKAQNKAKIDEHFEIIKCLTERERFWIFDISIEINLAPKFDVDFHVEVDIDAPAKLGTSFKGNTRAEVTFDKDNFIESFVKPSIVPECEVKLETEVSLNSAINFMFSVDVDVQGEVFQSSLDTSVGLKFEAMSGMKISNQFDLEPFPS